MACDEVRNPGSPKAGTWVAHGRFGTYELLWLAAGVMLLAATGGVVYYWSHYGWRGADEPLPRLTFPLEPQPAKPDATAPSTRYPFPKIKERLPSLDDSDSALQDVLAGLFGPQWLGDVFHRNDLVRRLVATVDSLPRRKLPSHALLFKPPAGHFLATPGARLRIDSENAARYAPYVRLAEAVDAKKIVAAYVYFYPLFQKEYRLLGYPSGQFNDRIVQAIDDLLVTPDVEGPIDLAQPGVMYEFADPELEALSAGERIMLRMRPKDRVIIKAKLREIRHELVAEMATIGQ